MNLVTIPKSNPGQIALIDNPDTVHDIWRKADAMLHLFKKPEETMAVIEVRNRAMLRFAEIRETVESTVKKSFDFKARHEALRLSFMAYSNA